MDIKEYTKHIELILKVKNKFELLNQAFDISIDEGALGQLYDSYLDLLVDNLRLTGQIKDKFVTDFWGIVYNIEPIEETKQKLINLYKSHMF